MPVIIHWVKRVTGTVEIVAVVETGRCVVPHVTAEVGMGIVNTRVDHTNYDSLALITKRPDFRCVDLLHSPRHSPVELFLFCPASFNGFHKYRFGCAIVNEDNVGSFREKPYGFRIRLAVETVDQPERYDPVDGSVFQKGEDIVPGKSRRGLKRTHYELLPFLTGHPRGCIIDPSRVRRTLQMNHNRYHLSGLCE